MMSKEEARKAESGKKKRVSFLFKFLKKAKLFVLNKLKIVLSLKV